MKAPCMACGTSLEMPGEYLNSVKRFRQETEKFTDVLIQDFIQNDLKPMLLKLSRSHSKLSQAEYNRNPTYNENHFSHKAEEAVIAFMKEFNLLDEFLVDASTTEEEE